MTRFNAACPALALGAVGSAEPGLDWRDSWPVDSPHHSLSDRQTYGVTDSIWESTLRSLVEVPFGALWSWI
jgi:hypothetical protein